jgi:hypothetical protein
MWCRPVTGRGCYERVTRHLERATGRRSMVAVMFRVETGSGDNGNELVAPPMAAVSGCLRVPGAECEKEEGPMNG